MTTTIAKITNVTKRYNKNEGIRDLSLTLEGGQAVGLLGLNGSGKSTTLKLLAGMIFPSQGSLEVLGQSPRQARGQIAYLSDADNLYDWMTPKDGARFMQGLYPDFNMARYSKATAACPKAKKPACA
jgi:ABC-2 type transport system ATP-binding protein